MNLVGTKLNQEPVTPFFSGLIQLASYIYKSWVIAIAIAAVAAIIAGLVLTFRYTRASGITLRLIGLFLLAFGLLLTYAKFRVHGAKVPSTTWIWIPAVGLALLMLAYYLRRRQARRMRDRVRRLANTCAERIEALESERGAPYFADQMTSRGDSAPALLGSLVRRRKYRKRGFSRILAGRAGSGKTVNLLKFARDCQAVRSGRWRPLIAMYIDLDEYAAQITENLSLPNFIQTRFIRSDSSELDIEKAWAESGRDVGWVFLFDNADAADLRQGSVDWSWQLVNSFVSRHAQFASFYVVAATSTPPKNAMNNTIKLDYLTDNGCTELLVRTGIDRITADGLARNEGLYWYLRDPGALRLLAPVLADYPQAADNNVHQAMRNAINHALQNRLKSEIIDLNSLHSTATAAIAYLMQASSGSTPDIPGEISSGIAYLERATNSSPHEIDTNLEVLAECGVIKLISGRDHTKWIVFSPAVEGYFVSCILQEKPDEIPIHELLTESYWRLAAISLLQVTDIKTADRFLREGERLVNTAIAGLNRDELAEIASRIMTAKRTHHPEWEERARREREERMDGAREASNALVVLAGGMHNRPELLGRTLPERAIEFTTLALPFYNSRSQAHLLEIRYTLGTSAKALSTLEPGLNSHDSKVVLDTASRIVNAINQPTELADAYRNKLINLIILVGLRSLTVNRERENLPAALKYANGVGVAAIVLYLTFFGLGGLLQLTNYWRDPFLQVCEISLAAVIALPMIAARYVGPWRIFIIKRDFQTYMKGIGAVLAAVGATWGLVAVLYDLTTFTLSLMPIIAIYILVWPICEIFYLEWDADPKIASVIFPLPRIFHLAWLRYIVNRRRKTRGDSPI
jgi:hypothetical protein